MIKKRRAAVICGILCVALVLTGCVGVHKDPDINTVSGSEKAEEAVSEAGLEDIALRTLETVKSFPTEEALTAFGGANADTEEMHALSEMIDAVEAEGKFVSFVVVNTATGKGFSYNADRPGTVQSTVKAPYVVSLIMENETILETEKERIKKS